MQTDKARTSIKLAHNWYFAGLYLLEKLRPNTQSNGERTDDDNDDWLENTIYFKTRCTPYLAPVSRGSPKTFRTRKDNLKPYDYIAVLCCFILIWPEIPFRHEVSYVYTSLSLDTN